MHLIIQLIIFGLYLLAFAWLWHREHSRFAHAVTILVFAGLFVSWQNHAYVISALHKPLGLKVAPDDGGVNDTLEHHNHNHNH